MIRIAPFRPAAVSLGLAVYALAASHATMAQESASRTLFDLEAARSVADEFPTVVPQPPLISATQASYEEPAPYPAESPRREPISDQQLMQAGLELTDRFDEPPMEADDGFDDAGQDIGPDDSTPRSRNSLKGFLLGCIGCLGTLLALKWLGGSLTTSSAATSDDESPTDPNQSVDSMFDAAPLANDAAVTSLASSPQTSPAQSLPPRRRRRGRKRAAQAAPPPQVMSVHAGWPTQLTVAAPFPIASPMPVPVPVAVPQPMPPIGYLPYPHQSPYPPQPYAPPPSQAHHYQLVNNVAAAPHDYSQAPATQPAHPQYASPQVAPQPAAPQQPAPHPPASHRRVPQPRASKQAAPQRRATQQPNSQQPTPRPIDSQQLESHSLATPQPTPRPLAASQRVAPPQAVSYHVDSSTIETSPLAESRLSTPTVVLPSVREANSNNRSKSNASHNDSPEGESMQPAGPSVDVAPKAASTTSGEQASRSVVESPAALRSGDLFARILEENRQVRVALDVAEL